MYVDALLLEIRQMHARMGELILECERRTMVPEVTEEGAPSPLPGFYLLPRDRETVITDGDQIWYEGEWLAAMSRKTKPTRWYCRPVSGERTCRTCGVSKHDGCPGWIGCQYHHWTPR